MNEEKPLIFEFVLIIKIYEALKRKKNYFDLIFYDNFILRLR